MRVPRYVAAVLLSVSSALVFAHTDLKTSVPEDGAMLDASPEKLELTFTQAVRLAKVELNGAEGESVAIDFKPSAEAAKTFSVALPELDAGNYRATWTAIGADTHKIDGTVSFMVHGGEHGGQHE